MECERAVIDGPTVQAHVKTAAEFPEALRRSNAWVWHEAGYLFYVVGEALECPTCHRMQAFFCVRLGGYHCHACE